MIFAEDYELIDSLEQELGETQGIERARSLYNLAELYFLTEEYLGEHFGPSNKLLNCSKIWVTG